ncbi:MAG TPA: acyltransferase family protein [Candidatus Sulfotelmatobacter sp.]|nr:acyltransferase family protein [Candidatus Sulfotelmatobacter sp.]
MKSFWFKPAGGTHSSLEYRPAIDGLRALAVLSVFVFHLNHTWLPGGFVGVDVFFVISGYLITSIIYKECLKGTFSLVRFYQRRIARIFPAFFLVGIVTLAGTSVVYNPREFASSGLSFAMASLSVINLKLINQGNYFQIMPDAQPYLHYWSLSVEEQFYIFFPLLLLLLFRRGRRYLLPVLWALLVVSFCSSIVLTWMRPIWAFYLLPTRAWELLAGCILAVSSKSSNSMPLVRERRIGSLISLGLVMLSFLLIHETDDFPGAWPLLPVIGTVGLLGFTGEGLAERFLALPALVIIGRISYSLYLWHWPIFSLVDHEFCFFSENQRLILKIAGSLLASAVSYLAVERPARLFLNDKANVSLAYVFMILAVVVSVPLGIGIKKTHWISTEASEVHNGGLIFDPQIQGRSVLLMGDSNASMYGVEIRRICAELGAKFTMIGVVSGDPLPTTNVNSGQLWLDSLAVVRRANPDCLVLVCRWELRLNGNEERLAAALQALKPLAKHVVILNQPPIPPSYANRSAIRNGLRPPFFESPRDRFLRMKANDYLQEFNSTNCSVVDIASAFTRTNGEIFFFDDKGRELYMDCWHLSGWGSQLVHTQLSEAIAKDLK